MHMESSAVSNPLVEDESSQRDNNMHLKVPSNVSELQDLTYPVYSKQSQGWISWDFTTEKKACNCLIVSILYPEPVVAQHYLSIYLSIYINIYTPPHKHTLWYLQVNWKCNNLAQNPKWSPYCQLINVNYLTIINFINFN